MRRGEVWLVNLEPAQGSEVNKTRPGVIVSNDAANRASQRNSKGVVSIVPLTSNTARVLPFQVFVAASPGNGLGVDSKAQAVQVRAVDAGRLVTCRGRLDPETLAALDQALRLHLGLEF